MQTLRVRELYGPSHFGNAYLVAGPQEMRAILSETRYWGFNRYSDWFDTVDLLNPYGRHDEHFNTPEAVWAQKFSHYTTAASLGFWINAKFINPRRPVFEKREEGGYVAQK